MKPRRKSFLSEVGTGLVPDTLWFRKDIGDTQDSAREIISLLGATAFDDGAFAADVAKTNLTAILQQHGPGNVRSL